MPVLQEHVNAPDFTLPDQTGKLVSLSDYRGKRVILAFYPKDKSPVCTTQFGEYARNYEKFREQNVEIIGINADTVQSHEDFVADCRLPFPLLSDTDKSVCREYDALSVLGTVQRRVYLIGEEGNIRFAGKKLPVFYHKAEELLELI